MLKRLVVLLLDFIAGLAGNLIAGWWQQDVWTNFFTFSRLLWTVAGAGLLLLVLAFLETERALAWNWWWHRYWYLRDILRDPSLRRWEEDFARLELAQGKRQGFGATVIVEGERQDLVAALCDVVTGRQGETRCALVLGEPGSGKTTGLERLALDLAQQAAKRLGVGRRIPVLVRLGNFQEGKLLEYAGQEIARGGRGRSGRALGRGIGELVQRGRVALLFDALDEALGTRREAVLAELANLLADRSCQATPIVITSRTREDPGSRLGDLPAYEIQDLNDEAVAVFVRAYKQPGHDEEEIEERLERYGMLGPRGLGRNPFWLRLIVESGAFAGGKGQILDHAVDTLLAREWDKPEAKRSWQRVLSRENQLPETKLALSWLAYRMSEVKQVAWEQEQALAELEKWLPGRTVAEGLKATDVLGLGRDAQVLIYEPGPVRFRHRLLQEFLTAWALEDLLPLVEPGYPAASEEKKPLPGELLERCIQDADRWEMLLLLAGLTRQHRTLVQDVLGDGRDARRLFLSMGLLWAVDEPDQEPRRLVSAAFAEMLRQDLTEETRRAAATMAGVVGGECILQAARDLLKREGEQAVRQRAVELVGEMRSTRAACALAGYLGDKTVDAAGVLAKMGNVAVEPLIVVLEDDVWGVRKAVAAETLGKIGDARAVLPLVRFIAYTDMLDGWMSSDDKEELEILEIVKETAARALEEVGKRAVESLITALKYEDWTVCGEVVEALVRIGELAVEPLIAALRDGDAGVRQRAARALGQIKDARAVEPLVTALRDGDVWVRRRAARALGQIKDARAVEPLLAALGDNNSRVCQAASEALKKFSIESSR